MNDLQSQQYKRNVLLSTKTQLILLFLSIFVLLTVSIGTYVLHHAERSLLDLQRVAIDNTLHQAKRSVLSFQRILFTSKSAQAIAVKSSLRQTLHILQHLSQRADDPIHVLRTFMLPADLMISVVDSNLDVIHQSPQLPYHLEKLSDIKGRVVGVHALNVTAQDKRPSFLVKTQKRRYPLHLYGEHFYLPQSKLLVGLWRNVTHLELMYRNIYTNNLESLDRNFEKVLLGRSGFMFVLNNKGASVIGADNVKADLSNAVTLQGRLLMEELTDSRFVQSFSMDEAELLRPEGRDRNAHKPVHLFALYVKPVDWYVMGVIFEKDFQEPVAALFRSFMMALCAVMVCILPVAIFVLTRMTAPLSRLSHHVRTLPEQDFTQERNPHAFLDNLASKCRSVEIRELAQSFLFMDSALRERVHELMRVTSQRERVEGELAAAIEVQKSILPQKLPAGALPGRVDIGFALVPAHEMGGDLYDFFPLDANRICFVTGDVSGKGMPAALFMSMTVTLIRSHAKVDVSLTELVSIINNSLAYENTACMFVTLCIGVLDMNTGDIEYINAGHNKPIIIRKQRNVPQGAAPALDTLDGLSGLVVGAMEGIAYSALATRLYPGDTLFLYTDGVTEAMNAEQQEYGVLALERALLTYAQASSSSSSSSSSVSVSSFFTSSGLIDCVLEDVARHVDGEEPFDDITMLCIHFKGNGET